MERKGRWAKEEDDLLKNCIEEFGEGKWHKVPRRAGLNRCRKSCRLRWLNYLSPNIKRGDFSKDEVDLLLSLHKLLGNRWSQIAGRLPGRTANDVKNFWNTHILHKKKSSSHSRGKSTSISENNIIIKPRPYTFSKSHVPFWSSEEVNKTEDENVKKKKQQDDDPKNTSVDEFTLINNNNEPFWFPEEEGVDDCIQWWLETEGECDELTPVTFYDGDGACMEPGFSPTQINQKITEFTSLLL